MCSKVTLSPYTPTNCLELLAPPCLANAQCYQGFVSFCFVFFHFGPSDRCVLSCFICTFLITSETQHSVWTFSFHFLLNAYLISFAHFSFGWFVIFLLICRGIFHIFSILTFCHICVLQIISSSLLLFFFFCFCCAVF